MTKPDIFICGGHLREILAGNTMLAYCSPENVDGTMEPLYARPVAAQKTATSYDRLADFQEGQWWIEELDAFAAHATADQKRAVAVVHNLLLAVATLRGALLGTGMTRTVVPTNPVHTKDGRWYFYDVAWRPLGPYETEAIATAAMEEYSENVLLTLRTSRADKETS